MGYTAASLVNVDDVLQGSPNYDKVHFALRHYRGVARARQCDNCPCSADQWAYQHNGLPEFISDDGRPFSMELIRCYEALCMTCHAGLDEPHMADVSRALRESGARKSGQMFADRMKSDPVFAEERITHLRSIAGLGGLAGRGGEATAARRAVDPELAEHMRQVSVRAGRKTSSIRRRCNDCGLITSPSNIVQHQRARSHEGWTQLSP